MHKYKIVSTSRTDFLLKVPYSTLKVIIFQPDAINHPKELSAFPESSIVRVTSVLSFVCVSDYAVKKIVEEEVAIPVSAKLHLTTCANGSKCFGIEHQFWLPAKMQPQRAEPTSGRGCCDYPWCLCPL